MKTILLITLLSLSACGASLGDSAFGTTGFMVEHNRKIDLLRSALTPSDRANNIRTWEK